MPTSGNLMATSALKPDALIKPETFVWWYHNVHIPDVLKAEGAPATAFHYTHADPGAKWQHMVTYPLADYTWAGSEAMSNIPKYWDGWEGPNGTPKRCIEYANLKSCAYETVYKYEGFHKKTGPAPYLVTAGLEVPSELEEEYDEWMQKQHLPMLSMVPVFRRSTRYKLAPAYQASGLPPILIVAEYDEPPHPEYMQIIRSTEWGSKMVGSFTRREMNQWHLAKAFGPDETSS